MGLFSSIGGVIGGLIPGAGPIGSAVGTFAGGLIDGKMSQSAARRQASVGGIDYVRLRNDAQAAGFNPLTALMAGGGNGYQRVFTPDLSTGTFIAEAVARGADTYFNQRQKQEDAQAANIRHQQEVQRVANDALSRTPRSTFGYDLTQQRVAVSPRSVGGAPLSTARPPIHPLDRRPEYIDVRWPDGTRGQLEASIARRLDINPFDTVSAGDWEEIVGDSFLTGVENSIGQYGIRATSLGIDPQGRFGLPPLSSDTPRRSRGGVGAMRERMSP